MATVFEPPFSMSSFLPSLNFSSPPPEPNQETHPISKVHVRLYCNTASYRFTNIPGAQVSYSTQTHVPSRVYFRHPSQLRRDLIVVLSNWSIPEIHHDYIINSTLVQLPTVDISSLPAPFLLRVDVRCVKLYYPNTDASLNSMGQERQIEATSGEGMIPASESAIKSSVVRRKVKRGEDNESSSASSCSICLEEFVEGCLTGTMPCSHRFHEECVTNWLRRSHYCPLCRFEVPTT